MASSLDLLFLGTGTSTGVPMIACDCPVCQSEDPRDKRLRSSILVRTEELTFIVDTGPDFRTQAIRAGLRELDAVVITHPHTDHIMGFDDLRRFTFEADSVLPVYASPETLDALRRVFDFAFNGENRYPGYFKPEPHPVTGPFFLGSTEIRPLPVQHGRVATTGILIAHPGVERIAYLPDCKGIPEATMAEMMDVDVLIIDALRHREHPTHLNVSEALDVARAVRAKRTWFTHLSHDLGHAGLEATLPENVRVAYDGLRLLFP